MMTNNFTSQSTAAVNSASKCIVNALEKSLKKINKIENSDDPMFSGWVKVQEDVRMTVWAGRCYDAETQTYSFSGTFALESKNHKSEYTTDVDCLVGVTSTERMTDEQCVNYVIEEFIKVLDSLMTNYNSGPFSGIGHNAYLIKYCYFGGAKIETPSLEQAPVLDETPVLDEAPVLDETTVLDEAPVLGETHVLDEKSGLKKFNIIKNAGYVMVGVCDEIILNGVHTDWNDVKKHMGFYAVNQKEDSGLAEDWDVLLTAVALLAEARYPDDESVLEVIKLALRVRETLYEYCMGKRSEVAA